MKSRHCAVSQRTRLTSTDRRVFAQLRALCRDMERARGVPVLKEALRVVRRSLRERPAIPGSKLDLFEREYLLCLRIAALALTGLTRSGAICRAELEGIRDLI